MLVLIHCFDIEIHTNNFRFSGLINVTSTIPRGLTVQLVTCVLYNYLFLQQKNSSVGPKDRFKPVGFLYR
jgi:hypothetical protein